MTLPLFEDRGATFSPCRTWRYTLWRIWDRSKGIALFTLANSSDAGEERDDPTVRKCRGFTTRWGLGGFVVTNPFAFVASKPKALLAAPDPVGPENHAHLAHEIGRATQIVVGWGACIPRSFTRRSPRRSGASTTAGSTPRPRSP